jgi:hypothetical protein
MVWSGFQPSNHATLRPLFLRRDALKAIFSFAFRHAISCDFQPLNKGLRPIRAHLKVHFRPALQAGDLSGVWKMELEFLVIKLLRH